MAQFQLKKGARRIGGAFHNDADPNDATACVNLLRKQAKAHGFKPAEVVLIAYRTGRTPKEYRAVD